jgi:hypothetical protein
VRLRFRRRHLRDGQFREDADAIERVLGDELGSDAADEDSFDLEPLVEALFEAAPTADIRTLRDRDVDAGEFFEAELRPNWEGCSQGERSAKVEAFVRLANVLGPDDPAGLGPVVRTKVLVLAWAYDRLYGRNLSRQLARKPQRFGQFEDLSPLREDASA